MVKLKKYNEVLKLFVIFLTHLTITSCSTSHYQPTKITGKQIPIASTISESPEIEAYIKPYREHINNDLNAVLAYCPEDLNKNDGKWQTAIGNLMADACLEKGNLIFEKREHQKIDLCILNFGGIRAPLPKGNITARNAYEIMPFENSLVVLQLKADQILAFVHYFITEKKAHPIAGMTFTIDKNGQPKNIQIQGKAFDTNKNYYLATNDYLANGGDNMDFFKNSIQKFDLDYKLRNILIDYFTEIDTVTVKNEIRITEE
ncbi:5'-nucleotidase C-terminal domain-containing protein [Flavobacterium agrisoli]|uniref:5'-nucleotidase C-terminal domain-containing protein n=1 Tax=Flavobacterium agrisoli TaxID=2793066 RepID=A0A934UJ45_9FLAO|nr:5'-nucleotidase [Flavobacterium agrisoli]MBK0369015.1 5'-nucleotidase C-terminal domain-containing protein [Flavobacterium agrisoli]